MCRVRGTRVLPFQDATLRDSCSRRVWQDLNCVSSWCINVLICRDARTITIQLYTDPAHSSLPHMCTWLKVGGGGTDQLPGWLDCAGISSRWRVGLVVGIIGIRSIWGSGARRTISRRGATGRASSSSGTFCSRACSCSWRSVLMADFVTIFGSWYSYVWVPFLPGRPGAL
jgi:hypothetical protein